MTSVKEKRKHHLRLEQLCTSCVARQSVVCLHSCFTRTYSRCCQSTSPKMTEPRPLPGLSQHHDETGSATAHVFLICSTLEWTNYMPTPISPNKHYNCGMPLPLSYRSCKNFVFVTVFRSDASPTLAQNIRPRHKTCRGRWQQRSQATHAYDLWRQSQSPVQNSTRTYRAHFKQETYTRLHKDFSDIPVRFPFINFASTKLNSRVIYPFFLNQIRTGRIASAKGGNMSSNYPNPRYALA